MTRLLTRRKQRWVTARRPDVVRGLAITPNAAVESRYSAELSRLIAGMCADVQRQITKLFEGEAAEQYFAMDISVASQARILTNALKNRFTKEFAQRAKPIAERMANASDRASSASTYTSMQQLSGGLSLPTSAITAPMKEILSATIAENVALIKSIPARYLTQVEGAVMRSITTGNGMKDLVPFLEKQKGITHRHAQLIAHDQTRKAMNNLSKGRMEKIGVKKYEWLHTGGSREPRKLHQEYNGRIFSFDDPPVIDESTGERGIPGQAINCRCRMVPVIEFAEPEE